MNSRLQYLCLILIFGWLLITPARAQQIPLQCSPEALNIAINEVFGGGAGFGNLEFLELYLNEEINILNWQIHWTDQSGVRPSFFLGRDAFDSIARLPDGTVFADNGCPANKCPTPTTFPKGTFLLYDLKSISSNRAEFLLTDNSNFTSGSSAQQLRSQIQANDPIAANYFYYYQNPNNRVQTWSVPFESSNGCGLSVQKGSSDRDISRLTDGSGDMYTEYPDGSPVVPTEGDSNMGGGGDDSIAQQFDTTVNIVKTANKTSAGPNEEVEFAISVTNLGPFSATSVVVSDIFPSAQLNYLGNTRSLDGGFDQAFGAFDPGTFTWSFSTLPVGSTAQLTLFTEVKSDTTSDITNIAQVDIAQTNLGNTSDSATIFFSQPLEFILLEHDGATSACTPHEITIRACLNNDCSQEYTDGVTGSLNAGGNQIDFTIPPGQGATSVSLYIPYNGTLGISPQTVRISTLATTPAAADNASPFCSVDGATANNTTQCDVAVSEASLEFNVPDFIAGTTQNNISVAAIGLNALQQCVPLFENVTRDIVWEQNYQNPTTGSQFVAVNGLSLSSPQTISMSFNGNGVAILNTVDYYDAGQIELMATYTGSSATDDADMVIVGSDTFVARPQQFVFENIVCPAATSNAVASAIGEPGDLSAFCRAGEIFEHQITARNSLGDITPNFGNEIVPVNVELSVTPVLPSAGDGQVGELTNTNPSFNNGGFSGAQSYSEVGIIQLDANTTAGYLGSQVVSGQSGSIGRFIPAYFSKVENTPELSAHSTGIFNYIGQPQPYFIAPEVELIARNMQDEPTLNYYVDDLFRYIAPADLPETLDYNTTPTRALEVSQSGNWSIEIEPTLHRLIINDSELVFLREAGTLLAPFDSNDVTATLTWADTWLIDQDDVCVRENALAATCQDVQFTLSFDEQRYGRLRLENIYGPENELLEIRAITEYWLADFSTPSTGSFVRNDDSTTQLNPSRFSLLTTNPFLSEPDEPEVSGEITAFSLDSGLIPLGTVFWENQINTAFSFTFEYDLGSSNLSALGIDDQPWLKYPWIENGGFINPQAEGNFGQYRGNDRIIFWLERGW